MAKFDAHLKCSFCGKSQEQVRKLIAGPGVYICDECIDLCNEILDEELVDGQGSGSSGGRHAPETGRSKAPAKKTSKPAPTLAEVPKPHEIKAFLDRQVVGQEEAKKTCQWRSTTITNGWPGRATARAKPTRRPPACTRATSC